MVQLYSSISCSTLLNIRMQGRLSIETIEKRRELKMSSYKYMCRQRAQRKRLDHYLMDRREASRASSSRHPLRSQP